MTPPPPIVRPRPYFGEQIEVGDIWRVVDFWWTENPDARSYVALTAPSGSKIAVSWSAALGWQFHSSPEGEE